MKSRKIKLAFIKFAGMSIGGSELWLQKIAANLPKETYEIDYYYCDDTPYTGTEHTPAVTSTERITYLKDHGVNVIKFNVGSKNIRSLTYDWVDTDFWEIFDESKYDIIQTVKAGPKEYPFFKIKKPIVEIVALANRPDTSKNIAWSFHSSSWQRAQWVRLGGSISRSSVLSAPVEKPLTEENYRKELDIPEDATVAGFHQRNDNLIASEIPLLAFAELQKKYPNESNRWHFIIKNGGSFYREQAKSLNLSNVHFLGQTPDSVSVSKFLNTLDIFAHGRKDGETFGAIFVEAMLHGKPCLSHCVENGANAQPETVGPAGVFAYTFEEYTDYLYRLFNDREYRETLASKAKKHAETYYSMDKCINDLDYIYKKIIKKEIKAQKNVAIRPTPYGYSDMGFLYAGDMDKSYNIAYTVLVGGVPEAFYVAIVNSLLPHTKTFFDIGANTGIYCWLAAKYYTKNNIKDAKVFAFEPQSECVNFLKTTCSLNNWEHMVNITQKGLGSKVDTMKLHLSGTGSSVTDDFLGENLPTETIEIETFDNFIQGKQTAPDFVKIDVEGFELDVLKGGDSSLRKNKPIIFIEIADKIKSRNYVNKNYTATLSWLFEKNYRIWTCEKNTIKEIFPGFHNDTITMYLCLEKNKHKHLIPVMEKAVSDYQHKNLYFKRIEKKILAKIVRKIIPPYITPEKIINLIKRKMKLH